MKSITTKQLHEIFSCHFGPPFLGDGQVVSALAENGTWKLRIGRRDIEISADGAVIGAGTSLLESESI